MSEETKIAAEVAEAEVDRIVAFFEVDPDGAEWAESRARLVKAMGRGKLTLEESEAALRLALARPIELADGKSQITELLFREPTAGDLKALDRYRDGEQMAKTIHLVSKMTGQPIGVIERLAARDLGTIGAVASLFF